MVELPDHQSSVKDTGVVETADKKADCEKIDSAPDAISTGDKGNTEEELRSKSPETADEPGAGDNRISVIYAKPEKKPRPETADQPGAGDDRVSVIYSKPDKKPREAISDNNNKDVESTQSENIAIQIDDNDDNLANLYAKPIKNQTDRTTTSETAAENVKNKQESTRVVSTSDDYATIRDIDPAATLPSAVTSPSLAASPPSSPTPPMTASLGEPESPDVSSGLYEEVKLHAVIPPANGAPCSVLGTLIPNTPPEKGSGGVVGASYAKSASVRETTSTPYYAQTQLVPPRSKSAHGGLFSGKAISSRDEGGGGETMVELGNPGIRKPPSIKLPGCPAPTVVDIPDYGGNDDEDFNAGYERVEIQNAGGGRASSAKMSQFKKQRQVNEEDLPDDDDENSNYERVEIQNKDATTTRVSAQRAVISKASVKTTTNGTGIVDAAKSGWAENVIYSSIDDDEKAHLVSRSETTAAIAPQLVPYEQTNPSLIVDNELLPAPGDGESDYEEIRRSRFADMAPAVEPTTTNNAAAEDDQFSESTTYEVVDGKMVPFSEL